MAGGANFFEKSSLLLHPLFQKTLKEGVFFIYRLAADVKKRVDARCQSCRTRFGERRKRKSLAKRKTLKKLVGYAPTRRPKAPWATEKHNKSPTPVFF